jgi:hypothetical protein
MNRRLSPSTPYRLPMRAAAGLIGLMRMAHIQELGFIDIPSRDAERAYENA